MMKRLLAAAGLFLAATAPVPAADFPTKPVEMIVNFGAGGSTDTVARLLADKMGAVLGQNVVVSNTGGAGGTLGVAATAEKSADGYHIGTANMPALAILPQLRELPYKPSDVVQIAGVMPYDYGIFAKQDAPYDTWEELVAYAKANPGKVTYGSVGTGTTNHLMMERIAKEIGISWRHVPFKGGAKAIAALVGGHVDIVNNTIGPILQPVKIGKVKPILVTSARPFKQIPDMPVILDKGFSFAQVSYMSIIAPAGIPDDVRSKLEGAVKAAAEDPEVLASAAKLDLYPAFLPGAEYESMLAEMGKDWGLLLKELGLPK
ncbi:tripartite tricarboxylate transporter substrate binding protein [Nisaea acidiphila]|uniref:Tripartite tricarboxylate transporter substrate binding protein n=1 Tax=Nisaea acidiphila TaxID=1862145 RepID=A0A9J7ANU1_9PROT|nr:tripartite tricarboxylate transporter substrate binding protein [Nisaea acidiphila]UUX48265.1 tripartite tricarboxylate transporter substrate binding protein [Nisaea acidiphila]